MQIQILHGRTPLPVMKAPQQFEAVLHLKPEEQMAVETHANICLVLDRSGSMNGEKIRKLREAAKLVVDKLEREDIISVITFDSSYASEVIISAQKIIDPWSIKSRIDEINDRGSTAMAEGMEKGIVEVKKYMGPDYISQIILITDGIADDPRECKEMAQKAGEAGIPFIAFGLGSDWNEDLLSEIAQASKGQVGWIDDPGKIAQFFSAQVSRMQDTVISDSWLRLKAAEGLEISQLWRMKPVIEKVTNIGSGREYHFQVGVIEKTGQTLYCKGAIPAISQDCDRRMVWGTLEYQMGNQKLETPTEVVFSFKSGVEPVRNPAVADWAGLVQMMDLHTRGTNLIKADPTKAFVATKMLENAAAQGRQLRQTGMLPVEADAIIQKIQEEADQLRKQGGLSKDGAKKVFMTGGLGAIVPPPTS